MQIAASVTSKQRNYRDKRRVTIIGAVVNLVLAIAKVVVGVLGQSQALIADGLHSLSDLTSDAMVLIAAKYGSQEADVEHPYGHARFETVATVGLGLLLIVVAIGIIVDATARLFSPETLLHPGPVALAVAVLSIASKEGLYHYTLHVAKRLRSSLLRANAWHHRSDAISSIVVFVGIAGTMAGLPYLDAIGAIGVSLMIGKIGWELGWGGIRELVDTGVSADELQAIKGTIQSVKGVESHHMLRTRRMGDDVLVEVHIVVGPQVTVSEGHMISDMVRASLKAKHANISDVMIHIDPEDDTTESLTENLPLREEVLDRLNDCWQSLQAAQSLEKVNLHYLEGKIDVEVVLPLSLVNDLQHARNIAEEFSHKTKGQQDIGDVRVYFH